MIKLEPQSRDYLMNFFDKLDKDFVPPLSKRNGGIDGIVNNVFSKNGTVLVDDLPINACIAYYPLGENHVHISWQAVVKDKRCRMILPSLVAEAYKLIFEKSPDVFVTARTWQGNDRSARIMEACGFKFVREEYDKSLDRISWKYEGNLNDFNSSIFAKRYLKTSSILAAASLS